MCRSMKLFMGFPMACSNALAGSLHFMEKNETIKNVLYYMTHPISQAYAFKNYNLRTVICQWLSLSKLLTVFDTESVRRTTHNLVVPRGMLVLAAVTRVPEPGADDVVTSGTGGQAGSWFFLACYWIYWSLKLEKLCSLPIIRHCSRKGEREVSRGILVFILDGSSSAGRKHLSFSTRNKHRFLTPWPLV